MFENMRNFVRNAERQSKQSIKDCYISIDFLYYEINLLNDMLNRYKTKRSGATLTYSQKKEFINEIYDRIPNVYKDINYYKQCINAEKQEIKRIHETYGYFDEDDESFVDVEEDNLEEINNYTYNFVNEEYEEVTMAS
jgi:hypothetical protein